MTTKQLAPGFVLGVLLVALVALAALVGGVPAGAHETVESPSGSATDSVVSLDVSTADHDGSVAVARNGKDVGYLRDFGCDDCVIQVCDGTFNGHKARARALENGRVIATVTDRDGAFARCSSNQFGSGGAGGADAHDTCSRRDGGCGGDSRHGRFDTVSPLDPYAPGGDLDTSEAPEPVPPELIPDNPVEGLVNGPPED